MKKNFMSTAPINFHNKGGFGKPNLKIKESKAELK
jgi:hypothetical protein